MKMGNCLHHQGYTVTQNGRLEPNDICSDSNKSDFMGSKGHHISDIIDTEDDAFMDNIQSVWLNVPVLLPRLPLFLELLYLPS